MPASKCTENTMLKSDCESEAMTELLLEWNILCTTYSQVERSEFYSYNCPAGRNDYN